MDFIDHNEFAFVEWKKHKKPYFWRNDQKYFLMEITVFQSDEI